MKIRAYLVEYEEVGTLQSADTPLNALKRALPNAVDIRDAEDGRNDRTPNCEVSEVMFERGETLKTQAWDYAISTMDTLF